VFVEHRAAEKASISNALTSEGLLGEVDS